MPKSVGRLLQRAGIDAQYDTLIANVHPGFREPPVPDREFVALMKRGRTEDVVVNSAHPLFGQDNIKLGVWQSSFFLQNYGTALFLAAPYEKDRIPVVLVHGINSSPRDFEPLVSHFADSRYQPILFFYPSGMALRDAARQLGTQLQAFVRRHRIHRFAVVGHSMGGLVAKGMLDEFDVTEALPGWSVFISISSPWRGIDLAHNSGQLPRHPPSWEDLPPESAFIRNINRTPFPDDLPFYLFFGARSGPTLFARGNNDGVLSVESVVDAPVCKLARDTFGFYEDHNSILAAPLVYQRLQTVLELELAPDGVQGSGVTHSFRVADRRRVSSSTR
jgi:pimeloyl-ACP methyl ester carboxylesterase